jgi:hypothetical protein
MENYHSRKIEIVHRLSEFGDMIDELANQAKELSKKNINAIPIEKLQQLAEKLLYLQDKTRIKIPCVIKGDLYLTAQFYPTEGTFENESCPDLWVSELKLGEAERVPKEDEVSMFGSETTHVYLRKDLQPDLLAFSELREFEEEIKALAVEYDVSLLDLICAFEKIKECKEIDEHYTQWKNKEND